MAEPLFTPPPQAPVTPAPPVPPATPTGPAPAGFTTQATAADPTTRQVQKSETVSGQLEDLFKPGNAVLETARESGRQQASERGLQNSSFGVQAGEQALISKATDIATQDANTYGKAATENLNSVNQFGLQKAGSLQRKDEASQKFGFDTRLSRQSFEQSGALSEQGFQQAKALSTQDYNETLGELAAQFENTKALSTQDQQELMQQLGVEHQNTIDQLGSKAALDRVQSQLDQAEAMQFEQVRSQLEEVRMSTASDLRKSEMITELENKLREIAASKGAQLEINNEQDANRLQLTYMQESGALLRQAMQDSAAVSTTQGISAEQQRGGVQDIWAKLSQNLQLIRSLYAQSPNWALPAENPLPPALDPAVPGDPRIPYPYAPDPYALRNPINY